jgi:cell division protein FtsA
MKFKTAMDVRIGLPNEHLAGTGKNEINQPMYATAVGLIMRGFDYLETYKKSFSAGKQEEFVRPPKVEAESGFEAVASGPEETVEYQEEPKTSLTDKIRMMMSKMFEVEDSAIN